MNYCEIMDHDKTYLLAVQCGLQSRPGSSLKECILYR